MEKISSILLIAGIILISFGVVGGIVSYTNVDKEGYKQAKEIYEELSTNEFAEAAYKAAKQVHIAEITYVLVIALGGIVSGLLLIGLGRVIELLEEKNRNGNETLMRLEKMYKLQLDSVTE